MRLLMIGSDTAAVQGIQGAFWNTLKGFHKYFERIDIICPFVRKPLNPVLFGNVYFHPLPKGKVLSPFFVLRQGLIICRDRKPDLIAIHSYGMQLMSWGALLLARKLDCPFAVEVHHIEGIPKISESVDILRRWSAWLFLRTVSDEAKVFRVVNKELPIILVKWGIPPEKIKVIYAIYLDRTIFHPLPEKKQYDIIFVGRLVPNKGLPILITAFKYLKREIPKIKLHIIGRGPLEGWLTKNIKGLNGIEHTHFLPSLQDIAKAYNQAKVVVCASYAEGGPRYVVEAMSCGLPVVSTPVGLMKEVVRDGEIGFLLKDWSPKEMAEKITLLLTDEDLYKKCSENAQIVAAQFDYDLTITAYAMFYRKLLEQP
jgi:glycosyltransferase involved in cell wall biosynthesis